MARACIMVLTRPLRSRLAAMPACLMRSGHGNVLEGRTADGEALGGLTIVHGPGLVGCHAVAARGWAKAYRCESEVREEHQERVVRKPPPGQANVHRQAD